MKFLVLQETNWYQRGPHQQHHLFERLQAKGHEVVVIDYDYLWKGNSIGLCKTQYHKYNGKIIKNQKIKVITPWMVRFPILNRLSIIPSTLIILIRTIKTFKPNYIINFGILNAALSLIIAKIYQIPVIYYLIDHLHTLLEQNYEKIIAKNFEIFNIRYSNALMTINQGLLMYANNISRCSKLNSFLIKGGVDFDIYQNSKIYRKKMRARFEINEKQIVIFFMGWIYNFSRLDLIANEIINNSTIIENVVLFVVGEGESIYHELCEISNKYPSKLIMTGKIPFHEIPKFISIADICILPNERNDIMENIVPIKIYEYLASNKPVLSTYLPGVYNEFGDSNGVSYFDTIIDFFEKITKISNNWNSLSFQATEFSRKSDWEEILKKFLISINVIEY